MVFCRQCQRKVEDCIHCVFPIEARRIRVFDEKVETLAYVSSTRTLEIAFKSGQVWQLAGVPDGIYNELRESTISSFLKFIAPRYKASPVKRGVHAVQVPESEPCNKCKAAMTLTKKVGNSTDNWTRVFWECSTCKATAMKEYGTRPNDSRRERRSGRGEDRL